MTSKKKNILISIIILLALFVFGLYVVYMQNGKVYEFAGTLDRVENGVVFANGFFQKNGLPIPGGENTPIELHIDTGSNTKITRLVLNIPTGVETFNTKDIKQDESSATLAEIQNDASQSHSIGIEAILRKGFLEKNYTAESFHFRVPVFGN